MKPFSLQSTPLAVLLRLFTLPSSLFLLLNKFGYLIKSLIISNFFSIFPLSNLVNYTQVSTLRFVLLLNFGGFCLILLVTHFLVHGSDRVKVIGWICVAFSVSVFAAPLTIMVSIHFSFFLLYFLFVKNFTLINCWFVIYLFIFAFAFAL